MFVQSGLLLTVVTLFIGNASNSLQPDNAGMTVAALQLISQQLQNSTAPGTMLASFAPSPEFEPDLDDVVIASLLASSLLLSLISSGMGLWVKEWLREYSLDLPYTARELVHVREYRHHGLERWHMRHLVASISLLLQIAVALFGIGTTMMTWKLNRVLSWVLTAGLALWTIAVWTAAVIPTVSSQCPFKSPLARLVYRVSWYVWPWGRPKSMVDFERNMAEKNGLSLELKALKYVNDEYWGSEKLDKINKCFKDVKNQDEARKCLEEMIVARVWGDHKPCRTGIPEDQGLRYLLNIWNSIGSQEKTDSVQEQWNRFLDKVDPEIMLTPTSGPMDSPKRQSTSTSSYFGKKEETAVVEYAVPELARC